ncbi:aryl-alcohol dehydrogenase-like predicted oxidoreductase [Streptomyces sp. B3I8]|nr:aryl-alcohol dehydrogenase-like predicted oxidoreductase [Streptomyces sp. B3I8]
MSAFMEQRHLGRTGLRVSRIGLGTLTWGRGTDEHDAADLLKVFWEAGGTLVDTADVYGDGEAEYLLGRLTEGLVPRRDLVISTKAGSVADPERRSDGSRGHLLPALDASLARLGTDYVDVWHVHAFDPYTPLEETLGALDLAGQQRAGAVRGRVRLLRLATGQGGDLAARRAGGADPDRQYADGVLAAPARRRA